MNKHKRIFIVGHSGAGKGILAQAVAKALNWKFIDADFALEPSIGRPMSEILGQQGAQAFQKCLSQILSTQTSKENVVVITDDSIVDNKQNREALSSEFTVYLKVSPSVQLERISHNRPLLPVNDFGAFLNTLRKERDTLYEQVASLTISSDSGELDEHAKQIIRAMDK